MAALVGPFAAFAVLLAVAGAPKARRPGDTVRALMSLGLPASPGVVRAFGAAEVVVSVGALVGAHPVFAWLVAASYALFACVVALALARGGVLSSCGCFGRPDTPPTATHLVLVVAGTGVAALIAVSGAPSFVEALADQPWAGLPFTALTAVCVWFAYLAMSRLPRLTNL